MEHEKALCHVRRLIEEVDVRATPGPDHRYKTEPMEDPLDIRIMEEDYWSIFMKETPNPEVYDRIYAPRCDRNYNKIKSQITKPEGLTIEELKNIGPRYEKLRPHQRCILYDLKYTRFFPDPRFWNQFNHPTFHTDRTLMAMMDGFISNYTAQETTEFLIHGKFITAEDDRHQWNSIGYNDRPELLEAQQIIWPLVARMLKLTNRRNLTHTHHDIMLALLGSLGLRTREIMYELHERYQRIWLFKGMFNQIIAVFNDLENRPLDLKPELRFYNERRYRARAETRWKQQDQAPNLPAEVPINVRHNEKRYQITKDHGYDAGMNHTRPSKLLQRPSQNNDFDYGTLGID